MALDVVGVRPEYSEGNADMSRSRHRAWTTNMVIKRNGGRGKRFLYTYDDHDTVLESPREDFQALWT